MLARRLFVSIPLVKNLAEAFEKYHDRYRHLDWLRLAPLRNLHVTELFLGDVPVASVDAPSRSLIESAVSAPFSLVFRKVIYSPRRARKQWSQRFALPAPCIGRSVSFGSAREEFWYTVFMQYDFSGFKQRLASAEARLADELKGVQTGRATPAILDSVFVTAYGIRMPLAQVGTISVEDARTLRVAAWDAENIKAIEAAIRDAGLSLGVAVDDKGVRVSFPELTAETRQKFAKVIGQKLEEARVSIRRERDLVWADIQKKEKSGEIAEDDKFRFKEGMEKVVKDTNEKLEAHAARKEKEILG